MFFQNEIFLFGMCNLPIYGNGKKTLQYMSGILKFKQKKANEKKMLRKFRVCALFPSILLRFYSRNFMLLMKVRASHALLVEYLAIRKLNKRQSSINKLINLAGTYVLHNMVKVTFCVTFTQRRFSQNKKKREIVDSSIVFITFTMWRYLRSGDKMLWWWRLSSYFTQ